MNRRLTIAVAGFLSLAAGAAARPASFLPLGDLSGGEFDSVAYDVSADASVIVGYATNATGNVPAKWTEATGWVSLGLLSGGTDGYTSRVSSNGQTVVGFSTSSSPGNWEAFRWTQPGGLIGMGALSPTLPSTFAESCSSNGSTIFGYAESTDGTSLVPARWTQPTGWINTGLPFGSTKAYFTASSDDGSQAAGARYVGTVNTLAIRWSSTDGYVSLGDLSGGIDDSDVRDMSADGSVIVGEGHDATGPRAFRWTQSGGMIALPTITTMPYMNAYSVSGDGKTIGGVGYVGATDDAFVWDAFRGTRSLQQALASYGVSTTGWNLRYVFGISQDGRTLVGWGIDPLGRTQAFRATIPTVCLGDANGDGTVNFADITSVLANFNQSYLDGPSFGDADLNAAVNFADVTSVLSHFGDVCQ